MKIIGEKINATIPSVREAITGRDKGFLKNLALEQEAAGAALIDLNVGTGEGDVEEEIESMKWLVGLAGESVGCKLCVDSADPKVLEAGLEAGGERVGLLNSVKATDKNISEVLPLAARHGVPVIGLAMDDGGVPGDVEARLRAAGRILEGAEGLGMSRKDVFIDPLVMPISTDVSQGMLTLQTLRGLKERFPGAKAVLAVSNVSFGLPNRSLLNGTMALMTMLLSADALLIDPLDTRLMAQITAGETLLGGDRHCRRYTRAARGGRLAW
jgi:5-methyltetrahydrofolate--homocysteine methyltransferase